MHNVSFIKFKDFSDKYGHLTPIESKIDIPFEIKRVYYITRVEAEVIRGYHSHRALHQILICLTGSLNIKVKTPYEEEVIHLNNQTEGIYIGPLIWREMYDFSPGAVLLVLASNHFEESDYIRNYDYYVEEAKKLFGGG